MATDPVPTNDEEIRCVPVWPGWLRLCHWLIAAGVLFQILSAWAIGIDAAQRSFWIDWHLIVGQAVLLALLLRLALMFRPGTGHWRTLLPDRSQLLPTLATLKFYLSLGRLPLPQWHAHNPLWKPVYLLLFALLLGCLLTGLGYRSGFTILGSYADTLHGTLAEGILAFTVLHVVAVSLHDLKGRGAFVSAMISGNRYFHVPRPGGAVSGRTDAQSVFVPVDQIGTRTGQGPERRGRA